MIINWGDAPFKAFITVTYPSGTCTVSLGDKSFTHSGGGTHTFTVNKKGTWTVTVTSAEGFTESTNVSVTYCGQVASVTLTCVPPGALFWPGRGQIVPFTLTCKANSSVSSDANGIYLRVNNSSGTFEQCVEINSPISMASYSRIKMVATVNANYMSTNTRFGLVEHVINAQTHGGSGYFIAYTNVSANNTETTYSVDVSSITASKYVCFFGAITGTITKIWLQ